MGSNHLLGGLPQASLARLQSFLEHVTLRPREHLGRLGDPGGVVYFPLSGIISLVTILQDGMAAEAAMVGREGVAGAELGGGNGTAGAVELISQAPGEALVVPGRAFRRLVDEDSDALVHAVLQFNQGLFHMAAQSVACNRAHEAQARLARWLLMVHDRVDSDTLPTTQEFLSQMLAVGRPTVSLAAGALQERGLIEQGRGRVVVADRHGLEGTACECYETLRRLTPSLRRPG